jgi:hypothetical protein
VSAAFILIGSKVGDLIGRGQGPCWSGPTTPRPRPGPGRPRR